MNKTVFMITFSFLNQSLWCDPHWNRLSETIPMSGHTIGFGWEIRKLTFWKLSILDFIYRQVSTDDISYKLLLKPQNLIIFNPDMQKQRVWIHVLPLPINIHECVHRENFENKAHLTLRYLNFSEFLSLMGQHIMVT